MTVVQELSFSKLNENLSAERGKYDGSREAAEKSSLKKRHKRLGNMKKKKTTFHLTVDHSHKISKKPGFTLSCLI